MQRYLLFDSGCSLCTDLAQRIERAADGRLSARSLRDPAMQSLLDRGRPGWTWEPTLLEVQDEQVRVFTGVKLRARLVTGLGPKRALRVYNLVRNRDHLVAGGMSRYGVQRRTFLKRAAAITGGLLFARFGGAGNALAGSLDQQAADDQRWYLLPLNRATELGTEVKDSQDYRRLIQELGTEMLAGQAVAFVKGDDNTKKLIAIPITYKGVTNGAAFSAVPTARSSQEWQGNRKNAIDSVALATESTDQGVHARAWFNSRLVVDIIMDVEGTVLNGWLLEGGKGRRVDVSGQNFVEQGRVRANEFFGLLGDPATGRANGATSEFNGGGSAFRCFLNCGNAQGIPSAILGLIAAICAALCIVTLGAACIACIGGVAGGFASIIGVCAAVCVNNPYAYQGAA